MSLISGNVGLIFQKFAEGIKPSQNIDFNDDTFSKILEKQINNSQDNTMDKSLGMDIGDVDGKKADFGTNRDKFSSIASNIPNFDYNKDMTMSEVLAFYPSIFDYKPDLMSNSNNGLFDFERKIAANSYGKYAKNLVTDLTEFVTDAIKIKS